MVKYTRYLIAETEGQLTILGLVTRIVLISSQLCPRPWYCCPVRGARCEVRGTDGGDWEGLEVDWVVQYETTSSRVLDHGTTVPRTASHKVTPPNIWQYWDQSLRWTVIVWCNGLDWALSGGQCCEILNIVLVVCLRKSDVSLVMTLIRTIEIKWSLVSGE